MEAVSRTLCQDSNDLVLAFLGKLKVLEADLLSYELIPLAESSPRNWNTLLSWKNNKTVLFQRDIGCKQLLISTLQRRY